MGNLKLCSLSAVCAVFIVSGCAASVEPSNQAQVDGDALLAQYQNYERGIDHNPENESVGLVRNEAINIGTQAGFFWAANEINQRLERYSNLLDQIDFRALLLQERRYYIVPPVITEDSGRRMIDDTGRYIRMIDKSYYIEEQPHFVLEPPTWRDYLLMSARAPDEPVDAYLPQNNDEREVWRKGIAQGFDIGIRQAELNIQNKIARLTNDYLGMTRYHILLQHNMVSEPKVRESYQAVVGGGQELSIEDSTVHIEVTPALNANRYSWEVIPRLPDIDHLFPDVMHINFKGSRE